MEDNQPLTKIVDDRPPPAACDGRTIAIVAPQWLQDGLAVVIKTIPRLQLVACTGSINTLLLIDLERSPDLVVFTVDESHAKAYNPIRQIKFVYPQARCLVLIQEPAQNANALLAGADVTLLQGASAEQFCVAVRALIQRDPANKPEPT
jgi:DNA-binding NarL/FixJ family response regulator